MRESGMIPAMSARSFTVFDTAIGACALVWGEAGIVGAFLPEDVKEHLAGLIRHYYGDAPSAEPFVVEPEAGR